MHLQGLRKSPPRPVPVRPAMRSSPFAAHLSTDVEAEPLHGDRSFIL